jgi:hypothetical protein
MHLDLDLTIQIKNTFGLSKLIVIFHRTRLNNERLRVLTASSMKMTASCEIAPCSLVEVDRRFRGAFSLHHKDDETLEYFNETTRRYIPEGCHQY